jgi:outer membrane protein assembly factor BamB
VHVLSPRRTVPALTLGAALLLSSCAGSASPSTGGPAASRSAGSASAATTAARPLVLQVATADWQLPAPVSRSVVQPDGHLLLVAGGLDATNHSSAGVFALNPVSGQASEQGQLAQAGHDAGGSAVGSHRFVFGGGTSAPTASVQSIVAGGTGSVVGQLPQPRADLAAATVDGAAYVVGGYDGSRELPSVLRTTDGVHFTVAATLPVTVRYPAVAVSGHQLWVFGGEHNGTTVDDVQLVDVSTGAASVVAHLPHPVAHASALALGDRIYLAGGRTGQGEQRTTAVLAFDPARRTVSSAGQLPQGVSDSGAAVVDGVGYLLGGETPTTLASVVTLRLVEPAPAPTAPSSTGPTTGGSAGPAAWLPAATGPGHLAPGSDPSVLPGPILIADKANNRVIIVDPQGRVRWQFPRPGDLAPGQTFLIPDDAFFSPDGREIIATEEDDYVVSVIDIATHRIVYRYGTPGTPGAGPNHLNNPDDAMMLPDGQLLIADIKNCRVLLVAPGAHTAERSYGLPGSCRHAPPTRYSSPNGAFPMANGHYLVTEIGGAWVSELGLDGTSTWSVHVPDVAYPSDSNEISPGRYLTVDYSTPGQVLIFDRSGRALWRYKPTGAKQLAHPSLALPLPNGMVMVNDDRNDRVIVINPATNTVVWQYGHTGVPGSGAGYLNTPDGMDLLAPYGLLGTHAATMGVP